MSGVQVLAARVLWCPACVSRAQMRGTVRSVATPDGTVLTLAMGDRVAGELWSVIPPSGATCATCIEPMSIAFEVRAARKGRGLGRSPREGAQRPLDFGRRNR